MAHALAVSPLAPENYPPLPVVNGVRLAVGNCGIRYKDRPDLLLAVMEPGTTVAGVFTTSLSASAPVEWCKSSVTQGKGRVLVVNSGNANAFTGKKGRESVFATVKAAAALTDAFEEEVFVASTGVIGEPLPHEKIVAALPAVLERATESGWEEAARAIMTTDTFPKYATRTAYIDGKAVTLNGIAKGSGMIAPDMATMLSFVFTDAALPHHLLQDLLKKATDKTFNAITVDSDTSTSDTLLLFATGKVPSQAPIHSSTDPRLADFRDKLEHLLEELALMVVRDGEGASKLISVEVTGAAHEHAAKRIAMSIANSPLVKTAIAGEDANWGRIVMAVGKSGEWADRDKLAIWIGGVLVAQEGEVHPGYKEAQVMPHMKGRDIRIKVDVGIGNGSFRVWTCDLTHGYIDINGSYRS